MGTGIGVSDPATHLLETTVNRIEITKLVKIILSHLFREFGEVNAALVDARRSPGLHSCSLKTKGGKLFGQSITGRFSNSSSIKFDRSKVHQSVEESTIGKHYSSSIEISAEKRVHSYDTFILDYQ